MRRLVVLTICFVLAGCLAPSLPLPPPEPEVILFQLDAEAGTATYKADPIGELWGGARVSVFDVTTGQGIITTTEPDGSVAETRPFPARDGDRIEVIYELDDQGAGLCLILHDGRSSSAYQCR